MASGAGDAGVRVIVPRDGAFACLVDGRQVGVVGLPSLDRLAEIGIEDGSDVAVVGDRVIVLARNGTLYIVDPLGRDGPEQVGELQLDAGSRILATSGDHLLVALGASAGLVSLANQPMLVRLPSRLAITAGGPAATADHFIVVVGGALEELSAVTRAPLRRFRLDKPVAARAVGGGQRQVWLWPEDQPDRIITIPLVGAGRPTQIELPEPASRVAADPTGASIAAVGARTGAISVAGLGERKATALPGGRADELAWRGSGALVCVRGGAVELIDISRGAAGAAAAAAEDDEREAPPQRERVISTAERLAQWKERASRKESTSGEAMEVVMSSKPSEPEWDGETVSVHEWRDAVASWTRRTLGGARGEPPLLAAGPLYDVGLRLGIEADEAPFLWLVYGARLCGMDGVAPVELAAMTPRRWEEALGRGKLAATGAFTWRRSRVQLVAEVLAALDEREPLFGTVAESAAPAERTVALVAPSDVALSEIGPWAAPHVGSLLVPNARGLRAPDRMLLEARARGLVAVLPRRVMRAVPPQTTAIVVEDAGAAAELHLPVALSWSA